MTDQNPTALLAAYARRARHDELDAAVREKAVLCLLDAYGLAVAARDDDTVRAARSIATEVPGGATAWPTGERLTVGEATLVNAIAAHAHFQDDTDMDAWAHPGSFIVPVAVTLAEHKGASLDVAVRGIVAGYAALNWLGAKGTVGLALVKRGFRTSPTLGTIASAVAAATVLDLDEAATTDAIGLAADTTGGVLEPVRAGAQDWRWQNGVAAWRGAMAGLLASAGVHGPAEPLAGASGFLATFCGGLDVPAHWAEGPTHGAIQEVWFKRYPIVGDNMAAAIAAADLHGAVDPGAVDRIDAHINAHYAAYPGTSYRGPFTTVEQAMVSTAFAVGTLLTHGDVEHADLAGLLDDATVIDLAGKTRVVAEDDYDYLDATVVVTTKSGVKTRHAAECGRTEFYRTRDTARQAYQRVLKDAASDLPDRLFGWLDGGAEPALGEVVR